MRNVLQSVADKSKAKAELAADLEAISEEKGATTKSLMATLEHISSLHAQCDWLLEWPIMEGFFCNEYVFRMVQRTISYMLFEDLLILPLQLPLEQCSGPK